MTPIWKNENFSEFDKVLIRMAQLLGTISKTAKHVYHSPVSLL